MKKLLALTLVALLSVSLFGCAQNTPAPTEQIAQPETVAQTQAPQTDAPTTAQTEAETVVETVADAAAKTPEKDDIGKDKAKEIALEHAGLKEADVTQLFVELDYDDGVLRYEVDFRQGQYEYDYDIDAKTGKILSYDKDFDD